MRTEVLCRKVDYDEAVDLLVRVKHGDGRRSIGGPIVFRDLEPGHLILEPTMRMKIGEAQGLMDELWRCGLRPTEGSGSAGSLAATERHLTDMQRIAFGLLQLNGKVP